MPPSILEIIVLFIGAFGGGYCLLLSLTLLLNSRKTRRFSYGALFWLCAGIWWLATTVHSAGLLKDYPHSHFVHMPFAFVAGPALFLHFKVEGNRIHRFDFVHLMPFVLIALYILPALFAGPDYKIALKARAQDFVLSEFPGPSILGIYEPGAYEAIFIVLQILPKISLAVYIVALMVSRFEGTADPVAARFLYAISGLAIFACILAFLHHFMSGILLMRLGLAAAVAGAVLLHIARYLYVPVRRLLETMPERTSRLKKDRTHVDDWIRGLDNIMTSRELFKDPELRLETAAQAMDIPRHKLSELLNQEIGKSFADYVNEFRVRAARNLLLEQPDYSVLRIAMDVGFNSKATFNRVFKKQTGVTPSQYRKEVESPGPENRFDSYERKK